MSFTKTQVDEAVIMARGKALMSNGTFTFSATTTPTTLKPAGGFTNSFAGSSDFTVDLVNATITCNFDGEIDCGACGSFSADGVCTANGHWYIGAVSSDMGFKQSINTPTAYGSFSGPSVRLDVSNGDVITFKVSNDTNARTLTFHDLVLLVQRLS